MIGKIRQWLIDTYNGLYVIVLKPHMPSYVAVAAVVLAMLFGILWGYVIRPVEYYDGAPFQLSATYRDEWVKGLAAAKLAGTYDDASIIERLRLIDSPTSTVERLLATELSVGLDQLRPLAQQAEPGTPAPRSPGLVQEALPLLLPVLLVIVGALVISPVWRLLIRPNIFDPIYEALRPKTQAEIEDKKRQKEERELIKSKREQEEALRKDTAQAAATNPYGAPMIQKLSIYTKGRGYDDSFAIEDEENNFYGECGATVAKQLNGELAAIEVWLFDKEDFVRTLTKIFVAQGSANDPAVLSEIENRVDNPTGDVVIVQPGAIITLETDLLLVQAKATDVRYGPGNAYFEGLTLQISAWYKKGAGVGVAPMAQAAPVAVPAVPAYNPPPAAPAYAPPMPQQPPAYAPTPYAPQGQPQPLPFDQPGARPVSPPMPPSRPPEDDPFGGTGDFTPISNR
jgi:hypothetical protein